MSRRNRILVIIGAALFTGAAVFGFLKISRLEQKAPDPLGAVPSSAFCVISSENIREAWKTLNQGNLVWAAWNETEWAKNVSEKAALVDSLLVADPDIAALLDRSNSWLSLHNTGVTKIDFTLSFSLPTAGDMDAFADFLSAHAGSNKISESSWKKSRLLKYGEPDKNGFVVAMRDGLVMISQNEALLKSGLDQLDDQQNLLSDAAFRKVHATAGKNVAANVFIHCNRLAVALKRIAGESAHARLDDLGQFAGWMALDLSLRPNAVLLNGFTLPEDTAPHFLSVFQGQQPQPVEADDVIPSNALWYIDFGISNIDEYLVQYEAYLDKADHAGEKRRQLDELGKLKNYKPHESIGKWLGNEIAVAEMPSPDGGISKVAFLGTTNTAVAKESMQALISKQDTLQSASVDSTGYIIRKIPLNGMLPITFGKLFAGLEIGYYTIIRQFVVFAPDEKTLLAIIADNENGHTLGRNKTYADFASNMAMEANVSFYVSPSACYNQLRDLATESFGEDLKIHQHLLRKFDGLAAQFSTAANRLFYTNIFVRHNPQSKRSISSLWETPLDSTFSGKPWLIKNHNTKGFDIFLQDDGNKLYLLSSTGSILWKRQLDEKIIGDVVQVDALKNDKLQLAFNTASSLHILDRNGNYLPPFPVKLPAPATNQVRVLDYDNNRDYRFLIACADKKVYNFTVKGARVPGWENPSTGEIVAASVQHALVAGKDYIIIVDLQGKTYITDRHGKLRLRLKGQLNTPVRQVFLEPGKDLSRTRLVSADSFGNVSRLSLSDELERIHFLDFKESPGFEYHDIDGDGSREFIFVDSRNLLVFNQDKTPVIHYSCNNPIIPRVLLFGFAANDIRMGIVCPAVAELHLVNRGGAIAEGFPLPGTGLFTIGSLNGENGYTLVGVNNGKYLCAYPFK
ncbi:MAG TPA: DUF3352 domain-containing protein [Bacteroidia bacterium]|nr:DUF3352 domain-containing protein [Bacteroidia bacterium]